MLVAELRAWSLVHGAVMLWIDGQLESTATQAEFLALVEEITAV